MRHASLAVFAVSMVLAGGCESRPGSIKIGIAMNRRNHQAVEMAVKEINAQGGVAGVPMELVGLNWQEVDRPYEAQMVLRWANRFTAVEDLLTVIGHDDSASTLSAAALYNQRKLPQFVTIATNPAITNIGGWTYRLCISDAVQGPALADYAIRDWRKRRIALFFVNDDYGRVLARLFEKRVHQLGGTILTSVMHRNALVDEDMQLIHSTIERLKNETSLDLAVLFQRPSAAIWTLGMFREHDLQCDVLGGDSLSLVDYSPEMTASIEGARVAQFFALASENPRGMEMAKRYRQFAGRDPDYGQVFAYDAVYLVRDAVLHGGFTREKIKAYLDRLIREKIPIEGAGGKYLIGDDHDARRPFHIVEIKNGRRQYLATLNSN